MYDQPETIQNMTATNLVGGKTGTLVSPLQSAVGQQGEQLDKLGNLLSQLEDRLISVRNTSPTPNSEPAKESVPASPVVNQVNMYTGMIMNYQQRINTLLQELEV